METLKPNPASPLLAREGRQWIHRWLKCRLALKAGVDGAARRMLMLGALMAMASAAVASADDSLALRLTGNGDFLADNGKVMLYRWLKGGKAYYTTAYRLEIGLRCRAVFSGPEFLPSLGKLGQEMRVEEKVDTDSGTVTDIGAIPNSALGYSRTAKQVAGGVLVEMKLNRDCFFREAESAQLKWSFHGDSLHGKHVLWGGESLSLPLLGAKTGESKSIRLPVAENLDLALVFLEGFKNMRLGWGDSPKTSPWNQEWKSLLVLTAKDIARHSRYFAILLRPDEDIPSQEAILSATAPKAGAIKKGNLLKQGSSFETGPFDGFRPYATYTHEAPISRFEPPPQPEISADSSAPDGANCLSFPGQGNFGVVFNPVQLELGKPYTLSLWLKAETPGSQVTATVGAQGEECAKTFTLTQEWKRYSFPFTMNKFAYLGHCPIRVNRYLWQKDDNLGFQVDALQLEEGDMTDYAPAASLEMGASIPALYNLAKAGERVKLDLRFRNNGADAAGGEVSYVVKDYWERPVKEGKLAVEPVPAKGGGSQVLDLGILPRGYYRAYFDSSWGEGEELIWGVFKPLPLVKVSDHWPFAGHEVCGEDTLYRQLGFGWMRCFMGWRASDLQPKPDMPEMDFALADKYLELADKAGINLMPVFEMNLSRNCHSQLRGEIPCWWASDSPAERERAHGDIYLPKAGAWKQYVHSTVTRYKGKIKAWEIMNETNYLKSETYLTLLKEAYEAAKSADPECKVVGICSTADMGGEPLPYTLKVLELGGWRYLDAVSIHMYGDQAPEKHFGGEDKIIELIKDACAKRGRKVEVWNTEKNSASIDSGYSAHKFNVPPAQHYHQGRRIPSFKLKGEYFLREAIITSSLGDGPFFWHCFLPNRTYGGYVAYSTYLNGPNYFEFDLAPRPELLAVNGLASLLDPGMSGAGAVDWGEDNRCALFASGGGTVAAVWNWKGSDNVQLPKGKFQLHNYFGEPLEAASTLRLEGSPKYLVFPDLKPDAVRELLAKAEFPDAKRFAAEPALTLDDGQPALSLSFRNLSNQPIDIETAMVELPEGWTSAAGPLAVKGVGAGRSAKASVGPLAVKPLPKGGKLKLSVKSGKQSETLVLPVLPFASLEELRKTLAPGGLAFAENRAARPVKLDGDLSDWDGSPAAWVADPNNPPDAACKLNIGWDKDFLYLAARVWDEKLDNSATGKKMLWNGDALEFFLNLDFADDSPARDVVGYRMDDDDFHATLAARTLDSDQPAIWWKYLDSDAGTKLSSTRPPDGYIVEAAIPWAGLTAKSPFAPAKGKAVGFSFILNDRDGDSNAKRRLIWKGDQGVNQSPDTWGVLIFK